MAAPVERDHPVTRGEFTDALDKLNARIEELFRAKQVSWPLIVSVLALTGGVLAFGIKNLADVAQLKGSVQSHDYAVQDFRERVRGLEAGVHAVIVENETQNRWMADVENLRAAHLEQIIRILHPNVPAVGYSPMGKIGEADPINGN